MSDVLIVGATGAVGEELRLLLEPRESLARSLRISASPRSVGRELPFRNSTVKVEELTPELFNDVELVFFASGLSLSTTRRYLFGMKILGE